MSIAAWFRAQPIAALAWIEGAAAMVAILFDAGLAAFVMPYETILHPWTIAGSFISTVICAVAIFTVPHRTSTRYFSLAVALVTLLVTGAMPPYGVSVIVLAVVLACRLSFAYGITGAFTALVTGSVALGLRVLAQTRGIEGASIALEKAYSVGTWVVMLGLIFGIIAVMSTYATAAAQAGAIAERARIALDLHDALGHGLTTLSVQLENAERLRDRDPDKADEYVRRGLLTTGAILSDVRETVTVLRSGENAAQPFDVLIDRLCKDFSETHSAIVRYSIDVPYEPGGAVRIALYRFIQEALTNVARHAQASRVEIAAHGTQSRISVRVTDDGRGFAVNGEANGLYSMRERIASVGGTLAIESSAGNGTTVNALVPLVYPS